MPVLPFSMREIQPNNLPPTTPRFPIVYCQSIFWEAPHLIPSPLLKIYYSLCIFQPGISNFIVTIFLPPLSHLLISAIHLTLGQSLPCRYVIVSVPTSMHPLQSTSLGQHTSLTRISLKHVSTISTKHPPTLPPLQSNFL